MQHISSGFIESPSYDCCSEQFCKCGCAPDCFERCFKRIYATEIFKDLADVKGPSPLSERRVVQNVPPPITIPPTLNTAKDFSSVLSPHDREMKKACSDAINDLAKRSHSPKAPENHLQIFVNNSVVINSHNKHHSSVEKSQSLPPIEEKIPEPQDLR